ncbi:hypothetical protein BJ944DRAFT_266398 [Cunninghamella echinulata]|nr:hypothetical protein BJ944DRAFT_266398 [Cunninghamella echinulata]
MTNTIIQHLEKQHKSLKPIQEKNQDPKQSIHNSILKMSNRQQFNSNTAKGMDSLMKDILSISTRFMENVVYVTLKDGTCFKGTLFNSLKNDKLQLTLTMVEEIKNGETIGQIRDTLNIYGHEIIDIQAIDTDKHEQNKTIKSPSYSKSINSHSSPNNFLALVDAFEPTNNIPIVNIPNTTPKKKEGSKEIITSDEYNNNKVINVYKENSYKNKQYRRNECKNASIKRPYNNYCVPTPKYDQNKPFQKGIKSNQTNKKQNYYNNNYWCYNNQYNEDYNNALYIQSNNNKKQPNTNEININPPFNENKTREKSEIIYNEVSPYRCTKNNKNSDYYSKKNGKKGDNRVLYNSSFPSPSTSTPLCYIPWVYPPLNNNHNPNKLLNYHRQTLNDHIMNDEPSRDHSMNPFPSSLTSTSHHHATYFIEEKKEKEQKQDGDKKMKEKSLPSYFKFNIKAVEFKPTATTTTTTTSIGTATTDHSIILNINEKIKTNGDKDNSSKLFVNKIGPSPFLKANLPAPNKIDPIWPYGKYSFKLEYQPPLVYAVQDFLGYIHYLYPHVISSITYDEYARLNKCFFFNNA